MTALPCALCGTLNLHENDDGSLNCDHCVWEWASRDAYFAEIYERARDEWSHADDFIRRAMKDEGTEALLRQVTAGLIALRADHDLILPIAVALNQAAKKPLPRMEVDAILLDVARVA